jgi:COP9 signalosome complex subunit 4
MRQLGNEYKLAKNIKIAMLYLEDDDAVSAETYIKKASSLIASLKVPHLGLLASRKPIGSTQSYFWCAE